MLRYIKLNHSFNITKTSIKVNLTATIFIYVQAQVETAPDLKKNLQNSFAANGGVISEDVFDDNSIHPQWKKLVFSACFFHAVVQGRRKFGAYGWNTPYDFITPDLEVQILNSFLYMF